MQSKTTLILNLDEDNYVYFKNVPCNVNEETDEKTFSSEVLTKLQEMMKSESKEVVAFPLYDFEDFNEQE
jgi:hypothetical protein